MQVELKENETIEDLQYKGLMLIQKKTGFRFGIDAVLLANFADVRKGDTVLDIGSGTGIISILIAAKTGAKTIFGLEIQRELAEMSERSIVLNNLQDRVKIIQGDIRKGTGYFGASKFDVIVVNPPYMVQGSGLVNPEDSKALSRHEIACTLEDIISMSSKLLVPGGQLAMVHRSERLADVLCLMREYSIEPKYIRFVHPLVHKRANIFLVKGARGGRPQLKLIEPLYIYDSPGVYSGEINRIYGRKQDEACGYEQDRACGCEKDEACGFEKDETYRSEQDEACGYEKDETCRCEKDGEVNRNRDEIYENK